MLIPVVLPVIFLGFYAYWLYWFGHHMHSWGAFKIKPFMPTVFGRMERVGPRFTNNNFPYPQLIRDFLGLLHLAN